MYGTHFRILYRCLRALKVVVAVGNKDNVIRGSPCAIVLLPLPRCGSASFDGLSPLLVACHCLWQVKLPLLLLQLVINPLQY